jgi:predicted nucleotidyltransferase
MPRFDYGALLGSLAQHEVEFIVVGGMSAYLHGVPTVTLDLDVVYRRDTNNIQRALAALQNLEARFRMRPDLSPGAAHLRAPGDKLLITNLGVLDLLANVGKQRTYDDLIGHTFEIKVGEFRVRVLRLEKLIELKEELGREKDLAMLPTLRRTLEEQRRLK